LIHSPVAKLKFIRTAEKWRLYWVLPRFHSPREGELQGEVRGADNEACRFRPEAQRPLRLRAVSSSRWAC
jgi:hypothetical protein